MDNNLRDRDSVKRLTFRLEIRRAVCGGILDTAATTFLLLFAIQVFQTGATMKALLVVGVPIGCLLSPLAVSVTRALHWSPARGAAWLGWASCAGFIGAASAPVLPVFVVGSLVGGIAAAASIPLLTQIYQDNYPAEERGNLFSKAVIVRTAATILFAWAAGALLDQSLDAYRLLLLVFALSAGLTAHWSSKFPSRPLGLTTSCHPLHGLLFLKTDPVFRWLQISWMLLGVGLGMAPLQLDYLGNPAHGIEMNPARIALLVVIIPSVAQLLFAHFWGRLFDRINFFLLRIVLHLLYVGWLISFFLVGGMAGFVAGGIFYGLAGAGSTIAWSLWATKMGKPELVAELMGVHTLLTGFRSIAIPFLAFYLANFIPMSWLACGAIASILAGSVLLVPEVRTLRRRRPGSPLAPGPTGLQE